MRLGRIAPAAFAAVAVFFGLCASLAAEGGPKPKRTCINKREINVITALDDRHVFLKASAGRFYMFTANKSCDGLMLARKIAIEGTGPRVCSDDVTLLSFETPTVGQMRCHVEMIDSVPDRNAALELIESRAGPR